jgi:hypothetical protein
VEDIEKNNLRQSAYIMSESADASHQSRESRDDKQAIDNRALIFQLRAGLWQQQLQPHHRREERSSRVTLLLCESWG